jgi:hypothetical protein
LALAENRRPQERESAGCTGACEKVSALHKFFSGEAFLSGYGKSSNLNPSSGRDDMEIPAFRQCKKIRLAAYP